MATDKGVPYFQSIFVKQPNLIIVEAIFRNVVLSTPGIVELNSFSFQYTNQNRQLNVEYSAKTINGDLDFSQILTAEQEGVA